MRLARASLLLVVAAGHGLASCGWDDADQSANTRGRGQRSSSVLNERATSGSNKAASRPERVPDPGAAKPTGSNPVAAAQEPQTAAAEEEEKRDLGRELLAAVGAPTDCLRPRTGPDVPTSLSVALEAVVVESGMVTRAYARSSALDPEESECVRKRLAGISLRGPIDEAPRTLTATLEFKQKPPEEPGSP